MIRQGSLFDKSPEEIRDLLPEGSWHEPCPACHADRAVCRLRPDTQHYAELRCASCGHFRWLVRHDR